MKDGGGWGWARGGKTTFKKPSLIMVKGCSPNMLPFPHSYVSNPDASTKTYKFVHQS